MKTNRVIVASVLSAALTACGGGGGGGGSSAPERPEGSAEGVAQHGPVRNANISAYDWSGGSKGTFISSTTSNSSGEYTLSLQHKDAPIWIASSGGDYQEESSARSVQMGADELRAIVSYESGKSIDVQLTFFTNAAACLAERMVEQGSTVGTAVTQANEIMTAYAGVPITATRPVDVTLDASFTTQETQGHRYGMVIAGISQALEEMRIADGAPESSTTYTSKYLANVACSDLKSDGLLDGIGEITNANPTGQLYIGSTPLSYDFYRTAIGRGVLTFASNENNRTGLNPSQLLDTANAVSQSNLAIFGNTEGQPVDTDGPVITNLVAENTLLAGTVDIGFQVEDPIGLGGSEVSFYLDGALVSTAQSSDPTLRLNTSLFADGEHTVKVTAQDALGNPSEKEFTYQFINTGAGVAITSPTLVNSTNYTASGTFVDSGAGIDRIEVNGVAATVDTEAGTWEANISLLSGENLVQVAIFDSLGNESEDELVVAVDLIKPTLNVWSTSATFTNYDGLWNQCELGDLTHNSAENRPVCLNAESVSLQGKQVSSGLVNENYLLLGGDIADAQGAGVFSDIENLVVEYSYQVENQVIVDWTVVNRADPDFRLVYVPIVTEYLGDNFFQTDRDALHQVTMRVTDEAGNSSTQEYTFRLDVLIPAFELSAGLLNPEIFDTEFNLRSTLNGAVVSVEYLFLGSSLPQMIKVNPGGNSVVTQSYEGAQRRNLVRQVPTRVWTTSNFFTIEYNGLYKWNGGNMTYVTPPQPTIPDYQEVQTDTIEPLPAVEESAGVSCSPSTSYTYSTYVRGAGGKVIDATGYADYFTSSSPSTVGGCYGKAAYINSEYSNTVKYRVKYEVEYKEGYPKNDFSIYTESYPVNVNAVRVFDVTNAVEIQPQNGWYSIPANSEIKITKHITLPYVSNYLDSRVSQNSSNVPYGYEIYEDSSLNYEIDTDVTITRAINPGSLEDVDDVSQTVSIHGTGVSNFSINR